MSHTTQDNLRLRVRDTGDAMEFYHDTTGEVLLTTQNVSLGTLNWILKNYED